MSFLLFALGMPGCHGQSSGGMDGAVVLFGDGGGGGDMAAVDPTAACAAVARAQCERLSTCSPFAFQVNYADVDTCVARSQLGCPARLKLSGTSATAQGLLACAQALPAVSCADYLSGDPGPACRALPGKLMNGAVCADDAQCQSTLCRIGDTGCGKCVPRAAAGQSCAAGGCDYGLACFAQQCIKRGAMDAACGKTAPCQQTLACVSGKCGMPAGEGAACTPGDSTCDTLKGLACGAKSKMCQAIPTAKKGEACGVVGTDVVICVGGTWCSQDTGGTCMAPAADGQMCDPDVGPNCQVPADCTNGTCQVPDPSICK